MMWPIVLTMPPGNEAICAMLVDKVVGSAHFAPALVDGHNVASTTQRTLSKVTKTTNKLREYVFHT